MMVLRRCGILALIAGMSVAGVALQAPDAHAATDQAGSFHLVQPSRLLDTRTGIGGPRGIVASGRTVAVKVGGSAGVPTTVAAVTLNITVTGTSNAGYLTAYPGGSARPGTSSVNFPKGWTGAAQVTIPVGPDGTVNIYLGHAAANVVVDVNGWYAANGNATSAGSLFMAVNPFRLYDSQGTDGPLKAGDKIKQTLQDPGNGIVPTAVLLNVTVTQGTGAGYLRVWSGVGTPPATSNLNWSKGETSPNLVVAPLSRNADGTLSFEVDIEGSGTVQAIADGEGFFYTSDANLGLLYTPLAPTRILDTRVGTGTAKAPLGPGASRNVVSPTALQGAATVAFTGTLTGATATAATYLTQWGADPRPNTSNLNLVPSSPRSNAVVTRPQGSAGASNYSIYNDAGTTNVVEDLTGRYDATPQLRAVLAKNPVPGWLKAMGHSAKLLRP